MNHLQERIKLLWQKKCLEMLVELKTIRVASDIAIAKDIGIDPKTLRNIIKHDKPISDTTARKIIRYYCNYFDIDPKEITRNLLETPTLDALQGKD